MRRIFYIFLVALAVLAFLYFYVDTLLNERLNPARKTSRPAIYSDLTELPDGTFLEKKLFTAMLVRRGYRPVSKVNTPGEFSVEDSTLLIFTNPFIGADGLLRQGHKYRYSLVNGRIENLTAPALKTIMLEPLVLARPGSPEITVKNIRPLNEIPESLKNAVISIEDQRFYSHFGLDLIGILRALYRNIRAGRIVEGGSTITQQLAKNLLFSPQRTITRKILEAVAALNLEQRYSKDKILELYLNEVYFGQEGVVAIHGVAEAARAFFDKDVSELTLSESALLAGLIRAPSLFSPRRHLKRALERRNLVLKKMLEQGYINSRQYRTAINSGVKIKAERTYRPIAPHFVRAVYRILQENYYVDADIATRLSIHTGLSPELQLCASEAVKSGGLKLIKRFPRLRKRNIEPEISLVAIEPFSGKIRAYVGSRDYSKSQFDHVIDAKRQIGSTIKPFLYLTALDGARNDYRAATPISILPDKPYSVTLPNGTTWQPENYDRKYRGNVTLRYALENSLNVPAAYVGQKVGVKNLAKTLRDFGFKEKILAVPALSLGALDTSLLELTAAYAALANGGIYVEPRFFISASEPDGEVLLTSEIVERRVEPENIVYVLTNILQGVIERGTGRTVRAFGYRGPAAGKTGTSSDKRDAWFVGFSPDLAAGVWVGYDDNSVLGVTGGGAAAPIWAEFMKCARDYKPAEEFLIPPGVVIADIDSKTGLLASNYCPRSRAVKEVFVAGTEPTEFCDERPGRHFIRRIEKLFEGEPENKKRRHRRKSFWDIIFGK
ncbi:MAG: PBP1A family penicillin-binding protein [Candidatus Dadabacteria bacterium]|nr:MAG: PBP1A family penicillin-binding protein [Candidatus Dadabacteria bacterium]